MLGRLQLLRPQLLIQARHLVQLLKALLDTEGEIRFEQRDVDSERDGGIPVRAVARKSKSQRPALVEFVSHIDDCSPCRSRVRGRL